MNKTQRLAQDLTPQERYRFLIAGISPRPIAWVGTHNATRNNLAPFSFFTAICSDPWLLAFCPMFNSQTGQTKDTVNFILETKVFTVNVVPMGLTPQMNKCSANTPDDEFILAGVTPIKGPLTGAPMVAESPLTFECQLKDYHAYGQGMGSGGIVVGQVVATHTDPGLLSEDGHIISHATAAMDLVARMDGQLYSTVRDTFSLAR